MLHNAKKETMPNVYKHYLFDLGVLLKERALEARHQCDKEQPGSGEQDFQSGRLLAFNEVISIMQQQAIGFGIPWEDIRLDDIEPDRDLA